MEPREQFTFYSSFAKAVYRIRKPAERCLAYDAIVRYALYGEEPDLDKLPDIAAAVFETVRPNLDSSRKRAEAGKAGGAKPKQTASKAEANGSKTEANGKQTESKTEAKPKQGEDASKKEDKKEDKKKKEKENECYLSPVGPPSSDPAEAEGKQSESSLPSPEAHFSGELLSAVRDWLAYKQERREAYKPMGLQALFTQLRRAADENGEAAVVEIIRQSMASGYQGLTLDRLRKTGTQPRKGATTAAEAASRPPQKPMSREELERILERI